MKINIISAVLAFFLAFALMHGAGNVLDYIGGQSVVVAPDRGSAR